MRTEAIEMAGLNPEDLWGNRDDILMNAHPSRGRQDQRGGSAERACSTSTNDPLVLSSSRPLVPSDRLSSDRRTCVSISGSSAVIVSV